MAFTATLEMDKDIAKISLVGELDASSATLFKTEIEKAAVHQPQKLVLFMQNLEYMASAGLRVLIFAKQKMGSEVDIYVVAPQEMVLDTLNKTGFAQSVFIVEEYGVAQV